MWEKINLGVDTDTGRAVAFITFGRLRGGTNDARCRPKFVKQDGLWYNRAPEGKKAWHLVSSCSKKTPTARPARA